MAQLGRAKSVKVQKENTVIVDGMGDKAALEARIGQIKGSDRRDNILEFE